MRAKAAQRPIGTSIYRIATSMVIALRDPQTDLPVPVVDGVGAPWVLAFTDIDAARARSAEFPGSELAQLTVVDLVTLIPHGWGVLIDPDSAAPLGIPADDRDTVRSAASTFPPGAKVEVDGLNDEGQKAIAGLPEALSVVQGVESAHIVWHRVEDADDDVLVIAQVRDESAWTSATTTTQSWLDENRPAFRVQLVNGRTIPPEFQAWFAERIPDVPVLAARP